MFWDEASARTDTSVTRALLECWYEQALSTEPIDHEQAESAVVALYAAAGMSKPEVLWATNPVAAAVAAGKRTDIGPPAARYIAGRMQTRLEMTFEDWQPGQRWDFSSAATPSISLTYWQVAALGAASDEMQSRREHTIERVILGVDAALRRAIRQAAVAARVRAYPLGVFLRGAHNPVHQALIEIGTRFLGDSRLEPWLAYPRLSRAAGYVLPFEKSVWLCARPSVIAFDELGLLHAEAAPALDWRGTVSRHFWHGEEVAASVVAPASSITLADIRRQNRVAHQEIMIGRVGAERYTRMIGAKVVQKDVTGRLWSKWHPMQRRCWCAVEVLNGTPEPDGSRQRFFLRVPPTTRTAREGVAWTYGLEPDAYDVAVRT